MHLWYMDESFEITAYYKNREIPFEAKLLRFGFSYKIQVIVEGQKILFEPDEERNYRAVIDTSIESAPGKEVDKDLLKAIAETIEGIVK